MTIPPSRARKGKALGPTGPRVDWSADEDAKLRALYPDTMTSDVAVALGRSLQSVRNRVVRLGLRKSEAFMASKPGVFRDGHTAWNKGKSGSTGNHPNCRNGWFRPGVVQGVAARCYQRIGSLRIKDGVLQRKLTDRKDLPRAQRWQPIHRTVWEAAHGPVPQGWVAVFKPGMATLNPDEVTLDRIECVSRAENMRRNSRHNRYTPELNQLIQLKGVLTRKINQKEGKSESY
ncbi:HNH endonuclease signature motif containing protein [Pseudoxanthomonas jiangsuensis]|uniref:HNH endonuclease signature motif containing protein n=1 Tax=Pseudoxanthomonas jiangsuensis TaxID=619688 RepID=UPI001B87777A|nr:HNH endonuclease signature motif containing protein [Pseudoxanthomonas jiangsuensis]